MKLLFVCLGNICRSPLAEGIMQHKIEQHGLDWEVDSAGTSGWHVGEKPDQRSIDTAKNHGLDITSQRSRKFRGQDLEEFDLIYAMDKGNYSDILAQSQSAEERNKVKLILDELYDQKGREVPDPYWGDHGFEKVNEMLNLACDKIVEKYRS